MPIFNGTCGLDATSAFAGRFDVTNPPAAIPSAAVLINLRLVSLLWVCIRVFLHTVGCAGDS
jgi:hypothetical protein